MSSLHASIDLGSNTAKLLVASLDNGELSPLVERIGSVRIGADEEQLSAETLRRLRIVLNRFRQTLSNTGARLERVVITGAMRRILDPSPALDLIRRHLSIEGEIITGEEEARLTWLAVRQRHGAPGFLCLDVGAGSSELSTRNHLLSVPIGALTLSKEFGAAPHPGEMRSAIAGKLEELDLSRFAGRPAFISGGTACAVASLALGQERFSPTELEGFVVDEELLDRLALRLRSLSDNNRDALPGLEDGRGKMVLSGIHLIEMFLRRLHSPLVRVSRLGLRYGVLADRLMETMEDPPEFDQIELPDETPSPRRRRKKKEIAE